MAEIFLIDRNYRGYRIGKPIIGFSHSRLLYPHHLRRKKRHTQTMRLLSYLGMIAVRDIPSRLSRFEMTNLKPSSIVSFSGSGSSEI